MAKMNLITKEQVLELATRAKEGDTSALQELKALNRRYAGIFNKRYARAVSQGMPTAAMERVLRWDTIDTLAASSRGKLSEGSRGATPVQLARQVLGVANMLRQGKNLADIKDEWNGGLEALRNAGFNVDDLSADQRMELRNFFRSRAFRQLLRDDSHRVIAQAITMIEKDATADFISEAYRKWQADQKIYEADAWHDLYKSVTRPEGK